jgi:hypothetical protein
MSFLPVPKAVANEKLIPARRLRICFDTFLREVTEHYLPVEEEGIIKSHI